MMNNPMAEIAIFGKDSTVICNKLNRKYHPNKVLCGTKTKSNIPLLKHRKNLNNNTIYVCYNKSCKLPVHTAEDALQLLV